MSKKATKAYQRLKDVPDADQTGRMLLIRDGKRSDFWTVVLCPLLSKMIEVRVDQLIVQEDTEARGGIKAILEVLLEIDADFRAARDAARRMIKAGNALDNAPK